MADVFRRHDPGPHPERPARYDAVSEAVAGSGAEVAEAPAAPIEALLRIHDGDYLEALRRICAAGGAALDADTAVNEASYEAAVHGSGAAMAAVDAVLAGEIASALTCGRPPGHHAERAMPMGFCIVNHVAVAAAHARAAGVERVAVLDWDAHHGNGTQAMFDDDAGVFYVSMHEWPLYPGTGRIDEIGSGPGAGATLNVPFPAGTTGDAYLDAIDNVVEPIAEQIRPDWVLISAGFDAHRDDPLTDLGLAAGDYADLTARVVSLAPARRVIAFLEGGYDLEALQASVAATASALVGGNLRPESATAGGPGRAVVSAVRELRESDPSRN